MSKRLYPDQDIADLVEADLNHEETFYKGRGPDLQPRKKRIDTSNPIHQMGSPEHKKFHADAKTNKIAEQNAKIIQVNKKPSVGT